jgi:hypothetical protein
MNKITQKQMVFYKLYKSFKEDPERWVAAWEFVGEIFVSEMNRWVLMSYKTPANGVAIYFENPGLIERDKITGKSGAKYYCYRFARGAKAEHIVDPELKAFYIIIKKHEQHSAEAPRAVGEQSLLPDMRPPRA